MRDIVKEILQLSLALNHDVPAVNKELPKWAALCFISTEP